MKGITMTLRKYPELEESAKSVLSGASPIQVKFIGWLVMVCAAGFGGWIWWAATVSAKLDTILTNQTLQSAAMKAIVEDVSRLKEWRVQIDTVGSSALNKRIDLLESDFRTLQKDFDLHKATTVKP